jgi:hypothetical protein
MKTALLCLCGGLIILPAAQAAPQRRVRSAPKAGEVAPVFRSILEKLTRNTDLPVRLPATLPDIGEAGQPVYAIVEEAAPAAYSIILAFTADCNGASVCRIGTLSAKRVSGKTAVAGKPVSLTGGRRGFYTESECGANCSDSVVTWREGLVEYSVGFKAANRSDVLSFANAILRNRSS